MTVPILRSVTALRAQVQRWKAGGAQVGVVPTMGALHDGHLSLVRAAQADCAYVIVTIFVNPRQFNSAEDLAKYPRTEEADAAMLAPLGVDAVFAPSAAEVYPPDFACGITVSGISERLEGLHRPGHFDGVATVVAKLFGMTGADRAYFGEKDWQQLAVIRRMVADLNLAVEVVGCPTMRDADGLAQSSRNQRLDPSARAIAPALHHAMQAAAGSIRAGVPVADALSMARAGVLAAGFDRVDYLDLCDTETLRWIERYAPPARLLAAAWVGGVRLIDNIGV